MLFLEFLSELSRRTNLPVDTIRMVYDEMLGILVDHAVAHDPVTLRGLGQLKDGITGKTRLRVAVGLKKRIKEGRETMEKLGVVTDPSKTKTAGTKKTCPRCGSELNENTNVPSCPKCGTDPFEHVEDKEE